MNTERVAGTAAAPVGGVLAAVTTTLLLPIGAVPSLSAGMIVGGGIALVTGYGLGDRRFLFCSAVLVHLGVGATAVVGPLSVTPLSAVVLGLGTLGSLAAVVRHRVGNLKRLRAVPVNAGRVRRSLAALARRLLVVRRLLRRLLSTRTAKLAAPVVAAVVLAGASTQVGSPLAGIALAAATVLAYGPFYVLTDWQAIDEARAAAGPSPGVAARVKSHAGLALSAAIPVAVGILARPTRRTRRAASTAVREAISAGATGPSPTGPGGERTEAHDDPTAGPVPSTLSAAGRCATTVVRGVDAVRDYVSSAVDDRPNRGPSPEMLVDETPTADDLGDRGADDVEDGVVIMEIDDSPDAPAPAEATIRTDHPVYTAVSDFESVETTASPDSRLSLSGDGNGIATGGDSSPADADTGSDSAATDGDATPASAARSTGGSGRSGSELGAIDLAAGAEGVDDSRNEAAEGSEAVDPCRGDGTTSREYRRETVSERVSAVLNGETADEAWYGSDEDGEFEFLDV